MIPLSELLRRGRAADVVRRDAAARLDPEARAAAERQRIAQERAASEAAFERALQRYWSTGQGRYVRAADLAGRDTFDRETERNLQWLARRKLLVVDELGGEKALSGPWQAVVERLVDDYYRAGGGRKLVLVTNLSVTDAHGREFWERYDAGRGRLRRRILEAGTTLELPCVKCAKGRACGETWPNGEPHAVPQPFTKAKGER